MEKESFIFEEERAVSRSGLLPGQHL